MNIDLTFFEFCPAQVVPDDVLVLPFEARQKARQRVILASGRKAGLKLKRGSLLRNGDCLRSECGLVIQIQAAPESVSTVRDDNPQALARAAYHLGNRHVWVEVGDSWIRYLHDHVLDQMLANFGLKPVQEFAPFEPEAGAYAQSGHGGHEHEHAH